MQLSRPVHEVQGQRVQEQACSDGAHPQEEGRTSASQDAQVRTVNASCFIVLFSGSYFIVLGVCFNAVYCNVVL